MAEYIQLPVSVPELRASRCTTQTLNAGLKSYYGVGRVEQGQLEWWGRGKTWRSAPGSIHVKEPGDVHRDLAHDGPTTFVALVLPSNDVLSVREKGRVVAVPHFEPGDGRAAPFHRLIDAVNLGADRLSLEVALAEAITTFARLDTANSEHTRPVRRAMEYLQEHLTAPITLEALSAHAALDKFHLCRAFRAQVGMPPHAYLIHLRVQRAKELLLQGMRASDLAPHVGLYDQSQLTRHFRRIVGTTPGRYASSRQSMAVRDAEARYALNLGE